MSDSTPFPWFTWKRLAVAGALILLAIHYWPQTVTLPTPCDQFYYAVAIDFTAPEFCGKITRRARGGGGGFNPIGYQTKYLRSECFYDLARATQNPDLCTEVMPLNEMFLDGSKFNEASCLENITSGYYSISGILPRNLREIMNKMGYSDRDVVEFKNLSRALADLDHKIASPIPEATDDDYRDFYKSLIYNPQKSEFLRRAAALK